MLYNLNSVTDEGLYYCFYDPFIIPPAGTFSNLETQQERTKGVT